MSSDLNFLKRPLASPAASMRHSVKQDLCAGPPHGGTACASASIPARRKRHPSPKIQEARARRSCPGTCRTEKVHLYNVSLRTPPLKCPSFPVRNFYLNAQRPSLEHRKTLGSPSDLYVTRNSSVPIPCLCNIHVYVDMIPYWPTYMVG